MQEGNENLKETRFDIYCKTCKYKDLDEVKDPCNECLAIGMIENTEVPENYVKTED